MTRNFGPALGAGAAIALLMGSSAAIAYPALPVGASLTFQATGASPKASFNSVAPMGWTGGGGLIFVDSNATFGQSAAAKVYLTTYATRTPLVSARSTMSRPTAIRLSRTASTPP